MTCKVILGRFFCRSRRKLEAKQFEPNFALASRPRIAGWLCFSLSASTANLNPSLSCALSRRAVLKCRKCMSTDMKSQTLIFFWQSGATASLLIETIRWQMVVLGLLRVTDWQHSAYETESRTSWTWYSGASTAPCWRWVPQLSLSAAK